MAPAIWSSIRCIGISSEFVVTQFRSNPVTSPICAAVAAVMFLAPMCGAEALAQQAAGATGRVEGIATISTQLAKSRRRMRIYTEPGQQAAPAATIAEHPLSNVVIYLEPVSSPARGQATATGTDTMTQRGAVFVPYVLPVMVGTSVEFPNDDPFYHNVFSLSRAR